MANHRASTHVPPFGSVAWLRWFRSQRDWRTLAARVVREEPVCWLRLPGCTVTSTTADHIIPASVRPELAHTRSNVRGACHHCNSARNDKHHADPTLRRRRPRKPSTAVALKHIARRNRMAPALQFFNVDNGVKNGRLVANNGRRIPKTMARNGMARQPRMAKLTKMSLE